MTAREHFPLGPRPARLQGRPALVVGGIALLLVWKLPGLAPWAAAMAMALLLVAVARWLHSTHTSRRRGTLVLDAAGLTFGERHWPLPPPNVRDAEPTLGALPLVAFDESCAQLVLGSAEAVLYLPVALGDDPEARAAFVERAYPVPRSDADNGVPIPPLDAAVALDLLAALAARVAGAASAVVGTTARGDRLTVTPAAVQLHRRGNSHALRIDLQRPFRVETFTFRERFGEGALVSQGISLAQGSTSLLLVAPLPPEFLGARAAKAPPPSLPPRAEVAVRALIAAKDAPPPPATRERHALDRPLLGPLRALLLEAHAAIGDEAPAADDRSHEPAPRSALRRKGRELLS